jgi:hypothetical protein
MIFFSQQQERRETAMTNRSKKLIHCQQEKWPTKQESAC